eukprot:CAMPEP_0171260012 /NCGR_PEP_ID=MMETSP0790-20130122/55233_1 /TAXON_ID=2925 /ORGANISM="Alexandrium catenella, Strain OF101" /LENGTH=236 /DNA_ID=CAMNT_0011728323 /DNA_START=1 /DNA_END=711 /DNA_ORIENTATION=-
MQEDEKSVLRATVAERAERFDEMAEFMKDRVKKGAALSAEERDLLSAAYKGALSGRRHAVRVASSVEAHEAEDGRKENAALAAGYRTKVEAELQSICDDAIALLRADLVPKAETGEPKVFYLKMQGDYCRYTAEFAQGEARAKVAEEARQAYEVATEEAGKNLLTTHPVRLGLALNYSVFLHEVLGNTTAAVETAQTALRSAAADVESMPEDAYRDAALTMQLLQDNLSLWVPEQQ